MSDESDPDRAEQRLIADLRQALPVDPAPPGLVTRGEALFELRDLDRTLAELLDTSAAEPAGARGGAPAPTDRLSFMTSDGAVALEVVAARRELRGQLVAGAATLVVLEDRTGEVVAASLDPLGRFSFSHAATGPARLRLRGGADRDVVTAWFIL